MITIYIHSTQGGGGVEYRLPLRPKTILFYVYFTGKKIKSGVVRSTTGRYRPLLVDRTTSTTPTTTLKKGMKSSRMQNNKYPQHTLVLGGGGGNIDYPTTVNHFMCSLRVKNQKAG